MHLIKCRACEYKDICMNAECLPNKDKELIIDAAIKFIIPQVSGVSNRLIMTGRRHADIFEQAFYNRIKYDKEKSIQGFLTNRDRFLDRYEAKQLAIENGQLTKETESAELYSEDLW